MRDLEERIKKGIQAIAKAKAEGKDTSEWEDHLLSLINGLPSEAPRGRATGHLKIKY